MFRLRWKVRRPKGKKEGIRKGVKRKGRKRGSLIPFSLCLCMSVMDEWTRLKWKAKGKRTDQLSFLRT